MLQLFNGVAPFIISFDVVVLIPIGIIVSIIFLSKTRGELDPVKKKYNKEKALWGVGAPLLFLAFMLIALVVSNFFASLGGN